MIVNSRNMVLGLQSSGKTTFAAALWYILANGGVTTVLAQGKHTGDYSYLDKIAERWEKGYKVPRTEHYEQQSVSINLVDRASGGNVSLRFTDLPGEGFERAFASRRLAEPIVQALEEIDGLMVFVSAADGIDNDSIIDVVKGLNEEDNEDLDVDDDDVEPQEGVADGTFQASVAPEAERGSGDVKAAGGEKEIPFTPGLTPRDVQLVDILSSVQDRPVDGVFPRIAVIVSAWDKVVRHRDPAKWLAARFPLLNQYLKNMNVPIRVYGVSAQGGDVPDGPKAKDALDRDKLLSISNAGERIKVVGHGADEHDLTHPIRWLSGLES
ncbi:hypothetical protein Rleg9DRAFT_7301 [Rhizobium leguminosarum bv. trifolii WSM597]|uniref:Double-GTPase 1 domain-containing protein n=1 Tax=Rhizobium leguminosarum bv. trifolii WSM597 TaxID=754764 RepID=J0GXH3_RHILT|nr:hypothetical protein [Rhizobium leguminosarum]EJB02273.1 hypothetical protein Rleg9DRAFT_1061 [Rhizobium leguminosarum bv. trifolii WSM597]EJB08260.1 hypothetical protein Rleg9DRAFT_7301 [Rhizobium leguminosarum bv. trifolii WSM597]